MVTMTLPVPAQDTNLVRLADEFWRWRAKQQPFTDDDIPRIARPEGVTADWSGAGVAQMRKDLAGFEERWQQLAARNRSVPDRVDYLLIGSAIARVRWELDIERGWQRNARFYVNQTLSAVYELLLQPPPISPQRASELVARMRRIPPLVEQAQSNLTDLRAPFARLAIDELNNIRPRLKAVMDGLAGQLPENTSHDLAAASSAATESLETYQRWLREQVGRAKPDTAIGREKYVYFLSKVAYVPYTPEQLLGLGRQEWDRSVSFESYEQSRNQGLPELRLFGNSSEQIKRSAPDEQAVRDYLEKKSLLTVPQWMKHYKNLPLPSYLKPLESLGVSDDLTGPDRLKEDGVSYIREPSPQLGYFALASARDPRPIIVHEGVPGHYFQLALAWAHEDPIRRHYYDSGPNEGIGFYAEEMMLQAGLFDDSPRTREIIYNFMRLRALRVEVDVKLALGDFSIDQAAEYLSSTVPMDRRTALAEAAMFASIPGQAITYQVGKLQILGMLADARRKQGPGFQLRAFHDFVWKNGNVPFSLQRWQLLDDASGVPR
jgi:uncharacterized protein (DUF885 family)